MSWLKKGRVEVPPRPLWSSGFLTPTPVAVDENTIRIFAGFWGEDGLSRLGFVDVSSRDPTKVTGWSEDPLIELGAPGCFDDNGMILGDVLRVGDQWRVYYVGFQKALGVKFLAFSGLLIANGDAPFHRYSQAPVLDRSEEGLFIGAVHTVMPADHGFHVWYSAGRDWRTINGHVYPCYEIYQTTSEDGIAIPRGRKVISCRGDEYRIGRPRVSRNSDGTLLMMFTSDTLGKEYKAGAAKSLDGVSWERDDSLVGIIRSSVGWDSNMVCYPVRVSVEGRQYTFYSGNGMGRTGFGFAEWME